jgi:hypothetical protein
VVLEISSTFEGRILASNFNVGGLAEVQNTGSARYPEGTLKWKYEATYNVYLVPTTSKDGTFYPCAGSSEGECVEENVLYTINSSSLKKTTLAIDINPPKIIENVVTHAVITGRLTGENGEGLSERIIYLCLNNDGNVIGRSTTDSNGYYSYQWENVLFCEEETHEIIARFEGDSTHAASRASAFLTVAPLMLRLEILSPPGGSKIYTNEKGRVINLLKIMIKVTNIGDTIITLNSTFILRLTVWFQIDDRRGGITIYEKDDLKLRPGETLSENVVYTGIDEFGLGDRELALEVCHYEGLCQGVPVWRIVKSTSIPLSFVILPTAPVYIPVTIKVLMDDGSIRTMELEEYIKGVIAAEMSSGWPIEALKAQAVVARTFAVSNTHHDHVNVDVCTSPSCCQAWKPSPYGKDIEEAVISTKGIVITYNGRIIKEALFFSHCNGQTRNSEDIPGWKYIPYLRSVTCGCAEVYKWSDYHGHGVGMCQYGARVLAMQGSPYVDILKHYYTDVEIVLANTASEWIAAKLDSPGELMVYDSKGRVTGVVNGTIKEDIPNSSFDEIHNVALIFVPIDSYRYEVAGKAEGTYGLTVISNTMNETLAFVATGIPTLAQAVHQYTIDWDALSKGEKGVTVKIDSDGDGNFDWNLSGGKELTRAEFTPPLQVTLRPWMPVIGAVIASILIVIAIRWIRRKKEGQPPPPPPPGSGLGISA